MLSETHELKGTEPRKVFPILGLCFKGKGEKKDVLIDDAGHAEESDDDHNHVGMTAQQVEIHHIKKKKAKISMPGEEDSDPLNQYGFGMIAYTEIMFTLSVLFGVLSVIMLPAMIFYNSQQGMPVIASFSQFSLGNFGYSTAQCQVSPFSLMSIPMKCPYGKLTTIRSFGVINANEPRKDICNPSMLTIKTCTVKTGIDTDIINRYRKQTEADQRKRTFMYSFTMQDIFGSGDGQADQTVVPSECTNSDARTFVSFTCE